MITHLKEATLALNWAKDEIKNFDAAAADFLQSNSNELVAHPTGVGGSFLIVAKQIHAPSDDMRRAAYRIVSDLRNALDQATHQASIKLGTNKPEKTNFPIGDTEIYVVRQLAATAGPWCGIPIQLHPKLLSFKPHFENGRGDLILRVLGQLANSNKHKIPLRTMTNLASVQINTAIGVDFWFGKTGRIISDDEIEILNIIPTSYNYKVEIDVKFRIIISENELIVDRSAGEIFKEMASRVELIISELDAEVSSLIV